jgi:DNA polymerase I-like protein with 3'-5' exonuclease and polymerase domains
VVLHKDDLDSVSKKVHELMENSTTLAVPLLVEVGSGAIYITNSNDHHKNL